MTGTRIFSQALLFVGCAAAAAVTVRLTAAPASPTKTATTVAATGGAPVRPVPPAVAPDPVASPLKGDRLASKPPQPPLPPPPAPPLKILRIEPAAGNVNIRSGPAADASVVGKLQRGQVGLQRERAGDWIRIDFGQQSGWVLARLIRPVAGKPGHQPVVLRTPG